MSDIVERLREQGDKVRRTVYYFLQLLQGGTQVSDDPASKEAFEWETTMAFAKQLADPWQGMGEMANHQRRLAAEMIVRLYNRCTMEAQHIMELRQQVKDLRGERDEARREVCNLNAEEYGATPEHHADGRGWNCFRETP